MLRASFIPPVEIRQLRDYTRLRVDLTGERSRHIQRLEKLLEDALIKLSSVATNMMGVSGRLMIEALIAGERDPRVLADLAKGRLRVKRAALIEALTGRFDEHHGELAAMLLEQIDGLTAQIGRLDARVEQQLADIPAAQAPPGGTGTDGQPAYLPAVDENHDRIFNGHPERAPPAPAHGIPDISRLRLPQIRTYRPSPAENRSATGSRIHVASRRQSIRGLLALGCVEPRA
jgi:hypothetical protein